MSDEQSMMPISATRREVLAQPDTLARVLEQQHAQVQALAQSLAARTTNRVLLIGSGDSWFAGMACRLAFEQYAGVACEAMQAYEYAAYGVPGCDSQTAAIVISSSGRPTTTWDALDRVLATPAYLVGITDKPYQGNPFHEKVQTALVPGASKVGWPAQTTTATIATLILLAIELGRARGQLAPGEADTLLAQLRAIPAHMQQVLQASETWATELATRLHQPDLRRVYTFVGAGPSLAVAYTGMALMAEGPQEVALAIAVEEFHHGLHIATISKQDVVFLIAPRGPASKRNQDTARSVHTWGAQLIALVDERDSAIGEFANTSFELPHVPEPMSALVSLLPLHQFSIALAALKVAGGYQRPVTVP